ncbi:MAG: MarR family EPS-associated transcriptional regulator [PVC group bacterium]|nr:MarR family EPS-associated transcriptional regulator [PVC group bacterium]
MSEHKLNEDTLKIIKEIESCSTLNQRFLSTKLGISLGKTNYLLKELIKKGLVKIHNFSHGKNKIIKVGYSLTPKGIEERLRLTYHFLKRKELEYDQLKKEWEDMTKGVQIYQENKEAVEL